MGFLQGSGPAFDPSKGDVIFDLMSTGQMAAAWQLLSGVREGDPPWAVYCKAYCLLLAGRCEEALPLANSAFRSLTEGIPQKPLDPVGESLLKRMEAPGPMHPSAPSLNPTFTGLQSRWLLCLCLEGCGRTEEASQTAVPLERLGIKPFGNEVRNRCRRWTTCF